MPLSAAPAGVPKTQKEFEEAFSSEAACRSFLERLRWQDGFHCLSCGSTSGWRTRRAQWRCAGCERQYSLTSGTFLDGTHKPLLDWVKAMWHVTGRKSGVSALNLKRALQLSSYQTAWVWLHRIRELMMSTHECLAGRLELDGLTLGASGEGLFRNNYWPAPIRLAVAVETEGGKIGKLRIEEISQFSGRTMEDFLNKITRGPAVVRTHRWNGMQCDNSTNCKLEFTEIVPQDPPGHVLLPGVTYIDSALRRWLQGTYCGAVGSVHFQSYLDEFTFRANHRADHGRADLFYTLLAASMRPLPPAATKTDHAMQAETERPVARSAHS